MNVDDLPRREQFAVAVAREAGEITLRYFRRDNFEIELKHDASPVTIADREAERHLRACIEREFPDDAILGEELGERAGTSGYRWILDPIDGTKSFVCGVPLYSTLIGLEHGGRSVLGVIRIPALDECAWGAVGRGAWHQQGSESPRRAHVSSKRTLAESLFCTSEVQTFVKSGRREAYEQLQAAAWLSRTWGDGYGYLMVATGRADVMVDPKMNVWDCAALQPVIEEAGGTFTDWNGTPTIHGGEAIATNGLVCEEVLAIARPFASVNQPSAVR